jgi:Uma2 family endonuclease
MQPRITYEEFLERYMGGEHVEWVDGEVVQVPAVTNTHADINLFLASLLRFALDFSKRGVVRTEPYNMKPGPNLPGRSPDMLVVTSEHLSRVREDHLEGPADVVFEIVSDSSRTTDCVHKYGEYQAGGVREHWIVDPERQTLRLLTLGPDAVFHEVASRQDGAYHSTVLPGIWIDPQWLWSKPLPSTPDVLRLWGLL